MHNAPPLTLNRKLSEVASNWAYVRSSEIFKNLKLFLIHCSNYLDIDGYKPKAA